MNEGLANLNVIELGGGISAPMAGKLLADLGATVLKVEPPGGDPARRRGPFRGGEANAEAGGTFLYLNANKRSLVLDLTATAGRQELQRLVEQADLLIHDFSPGEMEAHGVDYALFSALNRRLVMLSITPFGLTGPNRDLAASDLTLTHGGGWGWLCPGKGTPPERPPIKPFGQHALAQAALHGAIAALSACYGAAESGVGEHVDLSAQETVAFLSARSFANYSYAGIIESRTSPLYYEPLSFYPCQDGPIFLMCSEQDQWERLIALMGHPEWAAFERFSTRPKRGVHGVELKALISAWTAGWAVADLFHACQGQRVGTAPVFTCAQLDTQEHLLARDFFALHRHPVAGPLRVPGAPYRLGKPWWALRSPAPTLGEANSDETLPFGDARPAAAKAASAESAAALPLSGVRVLDFSWVWAGPHCTMMLAFLGAEVIKVESSRRPDITRRSPPYPTGVEPGLNRSGYFNQLNQGKKSVGIDLSHPEGIALAKELAAHCDVMISNYGTGVLQRLGLGPEAMHRVNPDLIIAMISAFGHTGPYSGYLGYGPLIAPLAGLSAQTGYADGSPQDVGLPYADPSGGAYAALAIAAALWHRRCFGGGGQVIDLSMWEALVCTGYEGWMNHVLGNPPYHPMGNRDPEYAPHNLYRCRGEDAWVAIAATDERQWRQLCPAIGRPELADDPRFRDAAARKRHEDALDEIIGGWCRDLERWDVTGRLQAAGVPAFPSLDTRDLVEDPHLNAREFFNHWSHPEVGSKIYMGVPWRLTQRPNGTGCAAPLLGQDTDDALQRLLGLDTDQRARLRAEKIVE